MHISVDISRINVIERSRLFKTLLWADNSLCNIRLCLHLGELFHTFWGLKSPLTCQRLTPYLHISQNTTLETSHFCFLASHAYKEEMAMQLQLSHTHNGYSILLKKVDCMLSDQQNFMKVFKSQVKTRKNSISLCPKKTLTIP